jgi:hypothetical protein
MPSEQYKRAKKDMARMEREQKEAAEKRKRKKKRMSLSGRVGNVNKNQRKMLQKMEEEGY